MGCGASCDGCGYAFGNMMYIFERLASCCAMTAVVTCIIATLMIMLATGIGVGYNYCYVDTKFPKEPSATTDSSLRSDAQFRRNINLTFTPSTSATTSDDPSLHRVPGGQKFISHETGKRSAKDELNSNSQHFDIMPKPLSEAGTPINTRTTTTTASSSPAVTDQIEIKPTMVLPLGKVDLLSFITRLKESKQNITLELVQ